MALNIGWKVIKTELWKSASSFYYWIKVIPQRQKTSFSAFWDSVIFTEEVFRHSGNWTSENVLKILAARVV